MRFIRRVVCCLLINTQLSPAPFILGLIISNLSDLYVTQMCGLARQQNAHLLTYAD